MQIAGRLNGFTKKITELESSLKAVQAERDTAKSELDVAKAELEKATAQAGAKNQEELENLNKTLAEKTAKIQALEAAIKEKEGDVRSLTVSTNKVKAVGRSFKERFEKNEAELAEKTAALAKVEEELKKARENVTSSQVTADAETGSVVSASDEKLSEAELLVRISIILCHVLWLQCGHNIIVIVLSQYDGGMLTKNNGWGVGNFPVMFK